MNIQTYFSEPFSRFDVSIDALEDQGSNVADVAFEPRWDWDL